MTPVRAVVSGFAARAKEIVAAPVPEAAEVNVIQPAMLAAVHGQDGPEGLKAKLPVEASAPNDAPPDGSENTQLAAACTTVCNWSPTVTWEVRDAASGLAATR